MRKLSNNCKSPRGFSMIAHCKAMGKIPRTGKKNKGKYIKSAKYRRSKNKRSRMSKRSRK
jgi:hypothetical protein